MRIPPKIVVSKFKMTTENPKDVAIIGAGISGIATAVHLLRRGVNVTIFERNSVPGGVW